jgi:hypothetical protein
MGHHHNARNRRRTFSDSVTAVYRPDAVPEFIDDDEPTVRVDSRQMEFSAQASMSIDTALLSIRRPS